MNGHPSRRRRDAGFDEATLAELAGWRQSVRFSARERAALELGYQIFASTFAKAFALRPQGFAATHAERRGSTEG